MVKVTFHSNFCHLLLCPSNLAKEIIIYENNENSTTMKVLETNAQEEQVNSTNETSSEWIRGDLVVIKIKPPKTLCHLIRTV